MSKSQSKIQEALSAHALDELSTEMLARYKKKSSDEASDADKKGDFKKGNKRFSGIMKATRKQFDNDAKNESVEAIEELSKKTLGSYIRRASHNARNSEYFAGAQSYSGYSSLKSPKDLVNNSKKRQRGIDTATFRLTKEEVESIEELSKKTLGAYYNKASVDSYDHSRKALDAFADGDKEKDDYHFKKMNKRELGKIKAVAKSGGHTNEGVESIDELSKTTLGAYAKKAVSGMHGVGVSMHQAGAAPEGPVKEKMWNRALKRNTGIRSAIDRLTKEEVESIDELSKTTLGSYIKKASDKARGSSFNAGQRSQHLDKEGGIGNFEYQAKKSSKAHNGIKKAVDRLTKEETEVLDELSKGMLDSYKNKATNHAVALKKAGDSASSTAKQWASSTVDSKANHTKSAVTDIADTYKKRADKMYAKTDKRMSGVMRANKRLSEDMLALEEAFGKGQDVVVQTATGPLKGTVSDVTQTHIGVKHPGVSGIVHYHHEYVKPVLKEDLDETLVEGVSWERWERSHTNSKDTKKSNRGSWMVSKHQKGYQYGHKEGEDHITVHGTGKEAASKGSQWAKEKGHGTVYMLESFQTEQADRPVSFGAIVKSALTTAK